MSRVTSSILTPVVTRTYVLPNSGSPNDNVQWGFPFQAHSLTHDYSGAGSGQSCGSIAITADVAPFFPRKNESRLTLCLFGAVECTPATSFLLTNSEREEHGLACIHFCPYRKQELAL